HLLQTFWRQGYATEICRALMDYSFAHLQVHRVNALCNPENLGSRRMLEACGLRLEAHFRQKCRYVKHGEPFWQDSGGRLDFHQAFVLLGRCESAPQVVVQRPGLAKDISAYLYSWPRRIVEARTLPSDFWLLHRAPDRGTAMYVAPSTAGVLA
ncbi:MAG: GNAT family N-acetyltransferase, partial [Clostridia bacterium]|nr:GNAT family N-acetyltransferase [Clostridia bacterium]